ncbi:hypothetical protein CPB83DRAFT_28674 [Crepidotus variabilis]|uniref:Uncharacterized protein n=1 Tax=Crepidotus variabilis TaxID=179855 RepID=A0A9P6EVI3_9AGAR|nr:hypothetical protein CPB83DRAFT_28674 [Crepidotus variabilis]
MIPCKHAPQSPPRGCSGLLEPWEVAVGEKEKSVEPRPQGSGKLDGHCSNSELNPRSCWSLGFLNLPMLMRNLIAIAPKGACLTSSKRYSFLVYYSLPALLYHTSWQEKNSQCTWREDLGIMTSRRFTVHRSRQRSEALCSTKISNSSIGIKKSIQSDLDSSSV